MFLFVKLVMLPIWLPLKLIGELIEHSGRTRRRRYRHRMRVAWTPGRARLTRWSSRMMRAARVDEDGVFRLIAVPFAILAIGLAWVMLVYGWILWWAILIMALPVALLV